MLCGSPSKIWNLANHMKKQNKKHQNAESIGEKLKNEDLMFFVSFVLCDLKDFKFQFVNRKAFGASFLYWVDFTKMSADSLAENTPNTPEFICTICLHKLESSGFQWKKGSLGVRSPCTNASARLGTQKTFSIFTVENWIVWWIFCTRN
jgi:hypothetical protein